ncbi:IclR family transcriptional regulator [Ottowia sp. VDI28]|uniref:IclR family transcriptional regulator n=1 Tax=Ottowia sp. VDI28 TaxID=3133968 RepID=UPI003C2BA283
MESTESHCDPNWLDLEATPHAVGAGRDVGAVRQALAVLRVISAAREPIPLAAIARSAGVSPSTTLNILRTLVNEGIVLFHASAKSYQLGLGLLELAGPLLIRSDVELAEPLLQQIASRHSATATIWMVRPGGRLLLAARLVPDSVIRIEFRVASRLPPYAGATGAMVAAARGASTADIEAGVGQVRWAHVPTPDQFLSQVDQARQRGYAVDEGYLIPGVTSVAAVAKGAGDDPRLVLSAHVFQSQLSGQELDRLGEELRELGAHVGSAVYRRRPR